MTNVEFIKELVPSFRNITDDIYLESRYNAYVNYMEQAEIPKGFMNMGIIENPLDDSMAMELPDYEDFISDINDFIQYEYNCIFNFTPESSLKSEQLAVHIIQNYARKYISTEDHTKRLLYIDAHELMMDLKRSIGNTTTNGDGIGRSYHYRYETLSSGIENYDFVIWNNIMNLETNFEKEELDSILGARHQRGLGNLFMTCGDKNTIISSLGKAHRRLLGCPYLDV